MSQVNAYKETVSRYVYELPSPTNATEIGKAISMAASQFLELNPERTVISDDSITIEAYDDSIRISIHGKTARTAA